MSRREAGPRGLLARLSNEEYEQLMAQSPAQTSRRLPAVIDLARCPVCAEWMPEGSRYFGECGACGVRFPKEQQDRITRRLSAESGGTHPEVTEEDAP